MSDKSAPKSEIVDEGLLDPVSRFSEILFGLIMVLTFTCSMSATGMGRSDVRDLLIGALGCNVAWGIIDAFFYLIGIAAQRGREFLLIRKLSDPQNQQSAHELYRSIVPESIIGSLSETSIAEIRSHLLSHSASRRPWLLNFVDFRIALLIFALVFLSTFPVTVPFMLMTDVERALRISNLIAILLLFSIGYSLGVYAGVRAWAWGLGMTLIGVALVSITIALGG